MLTVCIAESQSKVSEYQRCGRFKQNRVGGMQGYTVSQEKGARRSPTDIFLTPGTLSDKELLWKVEIMIIRSQVCQYQMKCGYLLEEFCCLRYFVAESS